MRCRVSSLAYRCIVSDIDLAIRRSKRLEHRLRRNFRVEGRGLHELIDAAKAKNALPLPLAKKLRFIATVRNKIVHDHDYTRIDDRRGFVTACDQAERELDELAGPRDSWRTTIIVVVALALMLLIGVAMTVWMLLQAGIPLW